MKDRLQTATQLYYFVQDIPMVYSSETLSAHLDKRFAYRSGLSSSPLLCVQQT